MKSWWNLGIGKVVQPRNWCLIYPHFFWCVHETTKKSRLFSYRLLNINVKALHISVSFKAWNHDSAETRLSLTMRIDAHIIVYCWLLRKFWAELVPSNLSSIVWIFLRDISSMPPVFAWSFTFTYVPSTKVFYWRKCSKCESVSMKAYNWLEYATTIPIGGNSYASLFHSYA